MGHIAPEAQAGGPIAWVEEGDSIDIDATTNSITLQVSDEVLQARQARWETPPLKATRGTLYRYIQTVSSSAKGCITDG